MTIKTFGRLSVCLFFNTEPYSEYFNLYLYLNYLVFPTVRVFAETRIIPFIVLSVFSGCPGREKNIHAIFQVKRSGNLVDHYESVSGIRNQSIDKDDIDES